MYPQFVVYLLCYALSEYVITAEEAAPTIAIIGAGIGGATSAHYLRDLFGSSVTLDVYEANVAGGRMATVEIGGKQYESGGTLLHPRNMYMVNFTKTLGLKTQDPTNGRLAIFDGQDMVFDGSSWSFVMFLQLLLHYGRDVFRLDSFVKNMINNFERIYETQDDGHAFTTVNRLLASMSPEFCDKLDHSLADELLKDGFGESFVNELVMGAMRSNYGQSTDIQSFVGSVSLAGAQPGLWRIYKGNKQVPKGLFDKSGVNRISSKVTKIKLSSEGNGGLYELTYSSGETKEYDIVILATPYFDEQAGIKFVNFPKAPMSPRPFHRTTATFVQGIPNYEKFGYSNLNQFPEELFTCNTSLFFNAMGKQTPIDFEASNRDDSDQAHTPVWKVFSQQPLTTAQLKELFTSFDDLKVVDWQQAYPQYSPRRTEIPPFEIGKHLYYVNAIEQAASAIEMSAIGGRNVANLAYNRWIGQLAHIDAPFTTDDHARVEL